MIYKYKIHCVTEKDNKFVLATGEPTKCPVDAAHAVDTGSISKVSGVIHINDGTPKELSKPYSKP